MNSISAAQYDMLLKYTADPHGSMKTFLAEHRIHRKCHEVRRKDKERARLCIEKGIYK